MWTFIAFGLVLNGVIFYASYQVLYFVKNRFKKPAKVDVVFYESYRLVNSCIPDSGACVSTLLKIVQSPVFALFESYADMIQLISYHQFADGYLPEFDGNTSPRHLRTISTSSLKKELPTANNSNGLSGLRNLGNTVMPWSVQHFTQKRRLLRGVPPILRTGPQRRRLSPLGSSILTATDRMKNFPQRKISL
ncbi:unnamed protein product [Nesidiocoris tenuis]|uniref:Uncharacterized protein n=1 Tax=Nesidiocoris tenuis TaxID=355587 RepID=A0A6H5GRJ8_9HEMI|nr:unnamed protein product [Nesidiocoris tenuis]